MLFLYQNLKRNKEITLKFVDERSIHPVQYRYTYCVSTPMPHGSGEIHEF